MSIPIKADLHSEARFTKPSSWCARPELWTARSAIDPEQEVLEFVAGLVRMMKPNCVYVGRALYGSVPEAVGVALAQNEHGACYWEETEHGDDVEHKIRHLSRVRPIHECPVVPFDLLFIDGYPDPRRQIKTLASISAANAVVMIHDTAPGLKADSVAKAEHDQVITDVWNFATPRGLTIARLG